MSGWIKAWSFSIIVSLLLAVPTVQAQENSSASEVYLSFQYRGIVSVYVTTYYKNDRFYLPVGELLRILEVYHQVHQGKLSISGNYPAEKSFIIDFNNFIASTGDTRVQLAAENFIIGEIDYFVKPFLFKKLFGLNFTVDFSSLTLNLEAQNKLPVVARYEREQKRQRLRRDKPSYARSYYPLKYDRNYGALDGAFLDYNLSAIYAANSQLFTFSNALGVEALGGDVQGNIYGAFSEYKSSFTTNGLRWRFVQRNNPYFSSLIAGQTNSEGILGRSFTGIKISNKPVEPRLLFDRYVIDGNVPPQSEVELYLNNRLIDYQIADQAGNYRFLVPLTYGSTNYSVRTFTPSGQQLEQSSRIQIPFDYLPPGEVDYSLGGGRLHNPILGSTNRGYIAEASLSTGLTEWLTAGASAEYLTNYHTTLPSFTGTINARLFSNYLLSANFNSENFYRLTSSVVYRSGASWSLSYDYNAGDSRLYSMDGSDHRARVNIFTPFEIGSIPLNIRWSSTYRRNNGINLLRFRTDLNTRLGRLNVRIGYEDQQAGILSFKATGASRITNSYTWSVGRYNSIPALLRGMFIRGQLSYLPGLNEFEEMEFQLSRDFLRTGPIQLSYAHNFLGDFSSLSLNFTIDFNNFRSNTTSRIIGSGASFTQSFRGSVAYDPYGNQFMLNNRQQVGQSGAAVRLFVDNNNDGSFQKDTDKVIDAPAVRLNRAAGRTTVNDGINYISQLRPYYRYDIRINKSALNNPLLVPAVENFSIITDPNQYKPVEIPFYLSGVIAGKVERKQDNQRSELSGVRLYLESKQDSSTVRNPFSKELRTFSDGSFYTYQVPPGDYILYIDPQQLSFLNAISKPDTMQITIEALAQGDFEEGLNFSVVPKFEATQSQRVATVSLDTVDEENSQYNGPDKQRSYYQIQLASFKTLAKIKQVAKKAGQRLENKFLIIQNLSNGLYAVRSMPIYKRSKAIDTIKSYHRNTYEKSALAVLKTKEGARLTDQNKVEQRPIDFSFKIQITSPSTDSLRNHLKLLAQSNSNITLDESQENLIIFDKNVSWKEVLNLYQKVERSPFVDHSVILLIEE